MMRLGLLALLVLAFRVAMPHDTRGPAIANTLERTR